MAGLRLKHHCWVVVADGERALFLQNEGDAIHPNLEVVRELSEENPPTREQGTDRPGRYHDGPSAHRSAVEDTDWHRIAKERFAEEIAEKLSISRHTVRNHMVKALEDIRSFLLENRDLLLSLLYAIGAISKIL